MSYTCNTTTSTPASESTLNFQMALLEDRARELKQITESEKELKKTLHTLDKVQDEFLAQTTLNTSVLDEAQAPTTLNNCKRPSELFPEIQDLQRTTLRELKKEIESITSNPRELSPEHKKVLASVTQIVEQCDTDLDALQKPIINTETLASATQAKSGFQIDTNDKQSKRFNWFTAALVTERVHGVDFAKDFFLPTTVNRASKINNFVLKIFAILGSLLFDILTFPIRLVTFIPRVIFTPTETCTSSYNRDGYMYSRNS